MRIVLAVATAFCLLLTAPVAIEAAPSDVDVTVCTGQDAVDASDCHADTPCARASAPNWRTQEVCPLEE